MKVLVIVLNREEFLDDVLSLFVEMGITGATIIDSVGMGRIISYNIPIFAGFRDLMSGNRPSAIAHFSIKSFHRKKPEMFLETASSQ